jgi:hypothetical protein
MTVGERMMRHLSPPREETELFRLRPFGVGGDEPYLFCA